MSKRNMSKRKKQNCVFIRTETFEKCDMFSDEKKLGAVCIAAADYFCNGIEPEFTDYDMKELFSMFKYDIDNTDAALMALEEGEI